MRIFRSIAAIVAGLGFMSATTTVGMLVTSAAFGETREGISAPTPPSEFFYVSLIVLGMGGVIGGWLAARIATFAPYGHAAAMAAIVAVVSIELSRGSASGARTARMVSVRYWPGCGHRHSPRRKASLSRQRSAGESGLILRTMSV